MMPCEQAQWHDCSRRDEKNVVKQFAGMKQLQALTKWHGTLSMIVKEENPEMGGSLWSLRSRTWLTPAVAGVTIRS